MAWLVENEAHASARSETALACLASSRVWPIRLDSALRQQVPQACKVAGRKVQAVSVGEQSKLLQ